MKLYFVLAFLLVALTAVLAAPIVDEDDLENQHKTDIINVNDVHPRNKRATCQISGVIGDWVGDSACFAHCLWLGHIHGGHCQRGTCYCD
ncbi:hypothetical protein KPH14_009564 [Odynerus spinipes]|uniref:Invertebrate defensins family profile domain-containing protein n=1 Tax=Odynerus spinipes TaxID=1348599 RepID=A0AAD9RQU6_9HYME|nr:hypothetical protein KPH14_009564 [Odynerus spinipes]